MRFPPQIVMMWCFTWSCSVEMCFYNSWLGACLCRSQSVQSLHQVSQLQVALRSSISPLHVQAISRLSLLLNLERIRLPTGKCLARIYDQEFLSRRTSSTSFWQGHQFCSLHLKFLRHLTRTRGRHHCPCRAQTHILLVATQNPSKDTAMN